ncbi:TPA: type IV secretion system protein [Legionella pneumophila]|nr:type IV secretion system protein [Legionella pneumophila]
MAFLYYDNVVTGLVSQIDTLLVHFIKDGYQALAAHLRQPLVGMGTLMIILLGYGVLQGHIKTPLNDVYKLIFRLGIVSFFIMSWGNFSFFVVDLFVKGSGELSAIIMKASHTPIAGKSVAQSLQSVFTEVLHVGWWTMKKVSLKNWWPYYTAFFIWISGLIVVGIALFEIIVSKIMMSICLVVAPLFLLLSLFEKSRSFFDRWLGTLVGFSLVLIFVSAVISLSLTVIHASIAGYLGDEASSMNAVGWVPILLVALLSGGCMLGAAGVAKSIGGSCHTTGGAAMVGGLIGGAVAAGMFAIKAMKKMNEYNKKRGASGRFAAEKGEARDHQYTNRGEI